MGDELIQQIAKATGLPSHLVSEELKKLFTQSGKAPSEATLDDVREILADYLQDVLLQAKEELTDAQA